jgi:serine/threonine protein phosphatase 1
MIVRLFRVPNKKNSHPPEPKVPSGERVYVIGDIHGRSDLLEALHARIEQDLKNGSVSKATVVYLGDYIDRGPDSSGVLELLCNISSDPISRILIKGNHETMLLRFLEDPQYGIHWRQYGGTETILSYRVDLNTAIMSGGMTMLAAELERKIPSRHLNLLRSLTSSAVIGDYFFCHAGVRPGIELERQREEDLLWIRDVFLESDKDFGKIIVHGHSPHAEPQVLPNRINIDTGAYATGRLTCLVLEGEERRFLIEDAKSLHPLS